MVEQTWTRLRTPAGGDPQDVASAWSRWFIARLLALRPARRAMITLAMARGRSRSARPRRGVAS